MLITILIHLPLPPPPSAPSWSQYMSTMYNLIKWQIFLSCIFFLEFLEVACNSDLSFEGVCGIKPYKVTLDLQSNSPFVEGSSKQFVRGILLPVRCCVSLPCNPSLFCSCHVPRRQQCLWEHIETNMPPFILRKGLSCKPWLLWVCMHVWIT